MIYPRQVDPQLCVPFNSERSFMEAFAFLGTSPTRAGGKLSCWVFEKTLEVYGVVRRFYCKTQQSEVSPSSHGRFHFAHGDLSDFNILIDPATGAVTGVIDWEMAAAVGGGWFNYDSERFLSKTRVGTMKMRLQPTLRSAHTSGSTWRRWTRSFFAITCKE